MWWKSLTKVTRQCPYYSSMSRLLCFESWEWEAWLDVFIRAAACNQLWIQHNIEHESWGLGWPQIDWGWAYLSSLYMLVEDCKIRAQLSGKWTFFLLQIERMAEVFWQNTFQMQQRLFGSSKVRVIQGNTRRGNPLLVYTFQSADGLYIHGDIFAHNTWVLMQSQSPARGELSTHRIHKTSAVLGSMSLACSRRFQCFQVSTAHQDTFLGWDFLGWSIQGWSALLLLRNC